MNSYGYVVARARFERVEIDVNSVVVDVDVDQIVGVCYRVKLHC